MRKKQFNTIFCIESGEIMDTIQKWLVTSVVGAMGLVGIILTVRTAQHRHHACMYEKVGKNIDEKLKESMATLEKATAHVKSVFEHIKNLK
jgi:hypothetical protein